MNSRGAGSAIETRPGRTCPVSYRYSPRVFDRDPHIVADTLYVVGGLYGNVEALEKILELASREPTAKIVFNGDFHWFDIDDGDFSRVTREVLRHTALRGNVETEIAHDDSGDGCGCAYPADVSDAEVSRSNEILARLRRTARRHPARRGELAALPMHLVARVGDARVGIVHGDCVSLAGWRFAHDRLGDPSHARWIEAMLREARVDIFASTHTCLPALCSFESGAIANNGAAGMPNFAATSFGLLTRISVQPFTGKQSLGSLWRSGARIDFLRIDYDHSQWQRRFLSQWPPGSPAHESYFRRIVDGPRFELPREERAA